MSIRNPFEEALNQVLDNQAAFTGSTPTMLYCDYNLGIAYKMACDMGMGAGYVDECLRELKAKREAGAPKL